jgi:signal-transduction protein with cAMP-binding, CBS, and nucleotidyltransferase domain
MSRNRIALPAAPWRFARHGGHIVTPDVATRSRDWIEVPPNASLRDFAARYAVAAKAPTLFVAEGGRYLGAITLSALGEIPHERWDSTPIEVMMDPAYPGVEPGWPLRQALALMRRQGVDRVPVLRDGRITGAITTSDVLRLEQILDQVSEEERRGLDL